MDQKKAEILKLVESYSIHKHSNFRPSDDNLRPEWNDGDPIPYAGRVFGHEEVVQAVSATLDFWLTLGENGHNFESELSEYLGIKHSLLVNSGSSANLLAISALTSHKLPFEKRIHPGDEVITVAAGFPTTVAPILQVGAVPVFIDAIFDTGNPNCQQLEQAFTPGKTKAVMFAHALGNPFDLSTTLEFCRKHDLWLIEDNCDALGCTYSLPIDRAKQLGFTDSSPGLNAHDGCITRYTGTWGDLSTQSFYPPHHLTMGEGGAVNIVSSTKLKVIVESFRDWGRDCWCPSGIDNSCNKRFDWQLGDLPEGYDHKYIYSHIGFNLKPLDIQAAIGRVQLQRLGKFVEMRKHNWNYLRSGLSHLDHIFDFSLPTHATKRNPDGTFVWDSTGCSTDCSWFGFKMSLKDSVTFNRRQLLLHLDKNGIGNRMLFGGNLVRQPAFVTLMRERPNSIRTVNDLPVSDEIMNKTLFLGTYPGLTTKMLDKIISTFNEFVEQNT